jgi:hypothetical protein
MIEISFEATRFKTICPVSVGESLSSRVQQIKKYLADFETG